MSERSVDFHGVMVTPETANDLTSDMILYGNAYVKTDGTRIPAWEKHGFKSEPLVQFPRTTVRDLFSDDPALD